MKMQVAIDQAIKAVCPIHGISFVNVDDKTTWLIDFKDEATNVQKELAQKLINDFVWDDVTQQKYDQDKLKNEYKDDLLAKTLYKVWLKDNTGKTFDDFLNEMLLLQNK